ncbi:transketolase [Bacteroides sp. OttesenSCG-928-D19]|nr:transketolase [Bacteroides sp. OttesenSCG-928-D19]
MEVDSIMNDLSEEKLNEVHEMCRRMRIDALDMALTSGLRGAHLSGSLSCIEIYAVLYKLILKYKLDDRLWDGRDRMIVGKEHARLAEFPAMAEMGFFPKEELCHFEADNRMLVGHPRNLNIGLEYSSCSLGMALSFAVGKAIYAKSSGKEYRVFVILGDAECGEGSIWEAIMSAAQYKLDNLTLIIDRNYLSVDGNTEELMAQRNMEDKLISFGWAADTIDGHNVNDLYSHLNKTHTGMPYAIIAETIKGKGVSFMENKKEWHQAVLTLEQHKLASEEILGE